MGKQIVLPAKLRRLITPSIAVGVLASLAYTTSAFAWVETTYKSYSAGQEVVDLSHSQIHKEPALRDTIDTTLSEDSLTKLLNSTLDSMLENGESVAYGLDTSVSPCEDHFQFVNGGWRKNTKLPPGEHQRYQSVNFFQYAYRQMHLRLSEVLDSARTVYETSDNPTIRVLGTFYESCMSSDTLETNFLIRRYSQHAIKDSTRQEKCRARILQFLPEASGQAIVLDLQSSGAVGRIEDLLSELKAAVILRLSNNEILPDDERSYALSRLDKLILRVGIPTKMLDYSELKLSPTDYENNKVAIHTFDNLTAVRMLAEEDRMRWKAALTTPNAFYMIFDHAIEIPAVMFYPPFFFKDGEDLLNYAGVGYIIGHEIFHSIAMQLNNSADKQVKDEIERYKLFITSLGEFDGWRTDGNRTFQEDVADLGGSRIAYMAWQSAISKDKSYRSEIRDGYTPEQRFYIAMGRIWRSKWTNKGTHIGSHGPNFARVNAVAMQDPGFKQAFVCQEGDRMWVSDDKFSKIW